MAGFSFNGKKSGGWAEAGKRLAAGASKMKKAEGLAVKQAALFVERELKKGLRSGSPGGKKIKPLSPMTRRLRRGRRPLIDTGAMLGSIKTTFDANSASAFVGVHRSSRTSSGESVVNVAVIHEFGTKPFAIPVTAGVRRLFLALALKTNGKIKPISSSKTVILHPGIPARPFIRPTIEKIGPQVNGLILKVVRKEGVV